MVSSSNHRKSRAEVHASPQSTQRWQPPASITIPISIKKNDQRLYQPFPPPPEKGGRGIHKNVCPMDEVTFHHDKLDGAIIIGAGSIDDSSVYSVNFAEMLRKADMISENAENMLKLLERAKVDIDSSVTSSDESDREEDDASWLQERLDGELDDDDTSLS
jgi:hypothetical protein